MSKQNSTQLTKESWSRVKLGDVVTTVNENEYDPIEKGFTKYVAGEHIESDKIFVQKYGSIEQDQRIIGSAFHRVFRKGQLLFGTRRAYLRKTGLATFDGICANTTLVLEPKNELIPELFPFIFHWEKFQRHAIENSVGSTNPYVRWRDLANFEFMLPPQNQQLRIKNILNSVQRSINNLENVVQRYSNFCVSQQDELLTKGFDHNKLEKRKTTSGSYEKIPKGWKICALGKLCKIRNDPNVDSDLFIGLEHIGQGTNTLVGKGNVKNFASTKNVFKKGDILYGKLRPLLNKVWLATEDGYCSTDILPIQTNDELDGHILEKILSSKKFRLFAVSSSAGTKMPRANWSDIQNYEVFLPSVNDQQKIASILSNTEQKLIQFKNHIPKLYQLRKDLTDSLLSQKIILKEQNNGI